MSTPPTPATPAEVPFTDEESTQLRDDGYVLVRGALPAGVLQPVREALGAVVDRLAAEWQADGLIADTYERAPFETRWARIREQLPATRPVTWRRVLVCRAMYHLWRCPALTGRISSWLGDELWAHDTWNGRPREPGAPVQTIKWHQDAYYLRGWEHSDGPVLTCWIPLVPVDARSGCLQVLPGSHRLGLLPSVHDQFYNLNTPSERLTELAPATVDAAPGDVLVFTERTVHRSLENWSDYVRWSVDIRFGRDSEAMRRKARGGFRCRTSSGGPGVETYEEWEAKYDLQDGAMGPQLRAIDRTARRSGAMARDMRTY